MRITLRVFVMMLLAVVLVVVLSRLGDPDCLHLTGEGFAQVVDTDSGTIFPRNPIHPNDVYNSEDVFYTAPNRAYRGNFQGRSLPSGETTFDFQLTAMDELGNLIGRPRVVYRDVMHVDLGGADSHCVMMDAAWLPDSQHILLYWMPDYFRLYCGGYDGNPPITQSITEFAMIDVYGNVSLRTTKTLPMHMYNDMVGDLETLAVEGFLPDENVIVLQRGTGTGIDTYLEAWSLTDFQPIATPFKYDLDSCYSPYESGTAYCLNWSDHRVSLITKQDDDSHVVVIHDFETGKRYIIPLPAAPNREYLLSSWSPNGEYQVASWWDKGSEVTQLMFDRNGNILATLPGNVLEDGYHTPKHNWTWDGNGLLYYGYDSYWNRSSVSKIYLGNIQKLVRLPSYLVNDSWYNGSAARGSQIGLVWNEIDERHDIHEVRIGVVDMRTGALATLYKFKDQYIDPGSLYEPNDSVVIHWLTDTRLAVTTSFAFAWGNTDGNDWHEVGTDINVYQDMFSPDGKSVLIAKKPEGEKTIYALNLETATFQKIMDRTDIDASLPMQGLTRSPSARFSYRSFGDATSDAVLQVYDSVNQHPYTLKTSATPLWSADERQFMLVTGDTQLQKLQLVDATTGNILHETTRIPVTGEGTPDSFGRCY